MKRFRHGLLARRRTVLDGIDLELAPGSTLGLVGPNGSGKSTLLAIVAGVEPPTAGALWVFGGAPSLPAVRRRIGYLPESSPFPGELTAERTLMLCASLHGMRREEARARSAALLADVGLAAHARRTLGRYSKGMLRRFGLAQAFLHAPDLVLLDEPTAGLDAQGFVALEALLAAARARGATLVIATHLLSDVVQHCDQLAVLLDGRIAAYGEPLALVGANGRVRVELEGFDARRWPALESWLAAEGARVVARGPATATLLELYRGLEPAAEPPR